MNDKMRVINQCEVCDEEKSIETVRAVCAASLQEVSAGCGCVGGQDAL